MRSYIALAGQDTHPGGWSDCLTWARTKAREGHLTRIFTARSDEPNARVVAEISASEERLIRNGRTVPVRKLRYG